MSNIVCTTKRIVINPHKEQILDIMTSIFYHKSPQYDIVFTPETTDAMLVDLLSIGFFTNLVNTSFAKKYLQQYKCHDCEGPATDRCHGQNEERPKLIKKALQIVRARSPTGSIPLRDLAIEFFRQHIPTNFTFKCRTCHRKEPKSENQKKNEAEGRALRSKQQKTARALRQANLTAGRNVAKIFRNDLSSLYSTPSRKSPTPSSMSSKSSSKSPSPIILSSSSKPSSSKLPGEKTWKFFKDEIRTGEYYQTPNLREEILYVPSKNIFLFDNKGKQKLIESKEIHKYITPEKITTIKKGKSILQP